MTKKVLLGVIITLFLASPALATGLIDGFCEQGNKTVAVGGLTSTTKVQASYPLCTVTVYLAGTGTLAPALYSDISNTPLANPFTATTEGHWLFYTADGRYDVVLSGGGMPAPVTRAGLQAQGILTAGTNITIVNDSISSYGGVSSIVAGTDITVSAATGAVTISLASGIVSAPFITETAVADLTGEFALSSLATGILKNTITTGIPSIAVAGSDYQFPMTAGTGITITSNAISRNVIDLASADVTGDLPLANLAQASAASKILGRGSASGAGDYQELSLGTGLSLSGTTLSATGLVTSIVAGTGITVSAATGNVTVSSSVTATAPGGSPGDLQYNNGGVFGGFGNYGSGQLSLATKTDITVASTLGGDIDKILSLPVTWNPSSGGGDFNAIWIEAIASGASSKSSIYGINLYSEDGGAGAVSTNIGLQDIVVSKASNVSAASFETHGNNGTAHAGFYGLQIENFNSANATTAYASGVAFTQRGGSTGTTTGSDGFSSNLDAGNNTVFTNHSGYTTTVEAGTGTVITTWSGYRVGSLSFNAGATIGTLIGVEIGNIAGGSANYAIKAGTGTIEFDDLKTTGSAGAYTVVCVDTATGKLYASSSGLACVN